ncbi:MAG: TFIIB-type zinc ribbon-containing protein, partial [Coriobacteriia bacterium]|nr:TFIIB-type zinc ribbon-containing protein [Coriobacteriia bacterium]
TIKCQGCGSEVVIDTTEAMTARCHWCRQILSIENQIPNGAVPDLVLPFYLSRQQAQAKIEEFVKKRTFFAHPKFKKEFTTENIMGVYLPYLVVDANVHSDMRGTAGHVARSYTVGSGKDQKRVYDIDIYQIGRDFDLLVDDLTVEASSDKLKIDRKNNTTNVINTILPFDVHNAVPYSGNYLKGFNSERRDTNIDQLRGLVDTQIADVIRYQAGTTATYYDAGIQWEQESTALKGRLWKAAYLPVWLYSYFEKKSDGKSLLHYVAVNARTSETMGSVPMNMPRLLLISALVELAAFIVTGGFLLLLFL